MAFALLDLIYPRLCGGCGQPASGDDQHLCWDCLAGLSLIMDPYCSRCGDPVEGMIGHEFVCSWCRREDPAFVQARSAARYRGPLRDAVQGFKYEGRAYLADDLALMLEACVRTHYAEVRFDAIAYVPLYPMRERSRTYNQSRLLAGRLAGRLGVGLIPPRSIRRLRNTTTQTGLTANQRRENVDGAFTVSKPAWLEGRTLLLVDDVMTTGATVDSCARALRESGSAGIYVVTVARG